MVVLLLFSLTVFSSECLRANAADGIQPYHADFEFPAFTGGSISGQQGWAVDQGRAEVTAGAGRDGSAGLVLLPSVPFSQARLKLKAPAGTEEKISFVDLYIRPVAGAVDQKEEIIDVNSARIGLFRTADPKSAALWVFDGNHEEGSGWLETAVRVPVDEATGRCWDWHRLTLREDTSRQIWDVWLDGVWAAANAGFEEPRQAGEATYIFMGDRTDSIALDDLLISPKNPLGEDADSDGLPDGLEKVLGFNPLANDREEDADGDGVPNLVQWVKSHSRDASTPLLGEANAPVTLTLSRPSALVEEPFEVAVHVKGEAAEIRYTLDGSQPSAGHGLILSAGKQGKISITQSGVLRIAALGKRGRIAGQASAAWIFPVDVARFAQPEDFPSRLPTSTGPVFLRYGPTAGMAPDTASVTASLRAAPIVVIAASPGSLFDEDHGIYARSQSALKAEVEVVMLHAGGTSAGAALRATTSLSGESSLDHTTTPKHSFRIKLHEPAPALGKLQAEREFVLRHPTQDSWVQAGPSVRRREALYFSDSLASAIMGAAGHRTLSHQFVHVFLNGNYWGVYDAVGQISESVSSTLLRGEKNGAVSAIHGASVEWDNWMRRLSELSAEAAQGAPNIQGWEATVSAVDQDNLIDYILMNIWLQNQDWPVKNFLIAKDSQADPFQFISWDAEESMRPARDGEEDIMSRISTAPDGPAAAFTKLSAWPVFRGRVLERAQCLFGQGALSQDSARAAIASQADAFRPLASMEAARWSSQFDPYESHVLPTWEKRVAELINGYTVKAGSGVLSLLEHWAFLRDRADASAAQQYARTQERAKSALETTRPAPLETTDADGDGLPDAWETAHGLDPANSSDAAADGDRDGICNRDELALGLDPRFSDDLAAHLPPPETSVFTRMEVLTVRRGQPLEFLGKDLPKLLQAPEVPDKIK